VKIAVATKASASEAVKKQKREPEAKTPKATPKESAEESPLPKDEPDPKKAKKLEAEQKKKEKNQKELQAKMEEMLTPEALGKLTKDKQYRASEFYIAIRKPKHKNKQTNKQTRSTDIDPETKQMHKRA
jgi:Spy/CpxP family protein refolding chaperone